VTDEFLAALDDCLNAVASGAAVEAAVARYPALADELRPLLEAARAVGAQNAPLAVPHAGQMSSRARFLARAAELRSPAPRRGLRLPWLTARPLAGGLAVVLALMIGAYGVVNASAPSLPGDPLYGVKRTVEQAQLILAANPLARAQLEEQFAARRVDEAQALVALKREAPVEFRGRVASIAGERWSVAGMTVMVGNEARVNGAPSPGAVVEVAGATQLDGTVRASQVSVIAGDGKPEPIASATPTSAPSATATPLPGGAGSSSPAPVETDAETPTALAPSATPEPTAAQAVEIEFFGMVESIAGSVWRIGGQTVMVNTSTELRGNPQVGQTVEVRAIRLANGSLIARRIEVKSSGVSGPSATHTPPAPEDRRTPEPTHTPGSGGSGPSPTHTPDAGGGSGPSPSNTPRPTRTPEPSHTAAPTGTPAPTATPTETTTPEEIEFEGTLQSIVGNVWTVSGQAVIVTADTEIKENPQVGDEVRVKAYRQPDGSLIAERIEKH
jgi:type VI secretion system secreted protein VgrG